MRALLFIGSLLILAACDRRKIVSEEELKDYVLDINNGLLKQARKNGVDIDVFYRPTELVVAQQLKGVTAAQERHDVVRNFDSLSYFIIRLSRQGQEIENLYAGDEEKFVRVVNYLSSSIGSNIYLVNEKDTIRAEETVYTGMFGSASSTSVMVVFKERVRDLAGSVTFHLDDTHLGIGQNEFVFNIRDIKKAPTLTLD